MACGRNDTTGTADCRLARRHVVRVKDADDDRCNGIYAYSERQPEFHDGLPVYKCQKAHSNAVLYYDRTAMRWGIHWQRDFGAWTYTARQTGRQQVPPVGRWLKHLGGGWIPPYVMVLDVPLRKNGFSGPLIFRQTLGVFLVLVDLVLFLAVVMPALREGAQRLGFTVSFLAAWSLALVSGLWAMGVDPADFGQPDRKPDFAPSDMVFCHYCHRYVRPGSRHCWDCNKCVETFDHHCPWLNNCVGAKNYWAFFVLIWSLFLMVLASAASAGLLLGRAITAKTSASGAEAADEPQRWPLLTMFSVVALLNGAFVPPLFVLVVLHVYLCFRGITTYAYIKGLRKQGKDQALPAQDASDDETTDASLEQNSSVRETRRIGPGVGTLQIIPVQELEAKDSFYSHAESDSLSSSDDEDDGDLSTSTLPAGSHVARCGHEFVICAVSGSSGCRGYTALENRVGHRGDDERSVSEVLDLPAFSSGQAAL